MNSEPHRVGGGGGSEARHSAPLSRPHITDELRWFGGEHGLAYQHAASHVVTPVGAACGCRCGRLITADDAGLLIRIVDDGAPLVDQAWLLGCFLRALGVRSCG